MKWISKWIAGYFKNCLTGCSLLLFIISPAQLNPIQADPLAHTQLALADSPNSGIQELRRNMTEFGPDLLASKPAIREMLTEGQKEQTHVKLRGPDSQTRTVAVNFQKAFEQSIIKMLHKGKITSATAIIHTDRPATPLCNESGQVLKDALPESIQEDPNRLKTIRDRTQTMRLLAQQKKIDLYVTYSHGGLKKRSEKEQAIFKQETRNRRNIALHDVELSCPTIPRQLSGATYILQLANGEHLFFSLTGSQAQDADKTMDWEYWFDSLNNPKMKQRLDQVLNFLKDCGLSIKV